MISPGTQRYELVVNLKWGVGLSKIVKKLKYKTARESARTPSFACLQDLLFHYGRNAPDRHAILAPGRLPMTYGALLLQTRDVVRGQRSVGVGRTDRVAAVLPNGPEATVAMVAVAAGAVCVPLNPGFTYDEYERYFGELHLAALLAHADPTSASRRAAHTLGIPIIEVVTRPHDGAGAFNIVGRVPRRAPDDEFASSADDAFILLTSGSTSRPKTVPLTHASVCLVCVTGRRRPGKNHKRAARRRPHRLLGFLAAHVADHEGGRANL